MIRILKLGGGAGVEHTRALHNLAQRVLDGEQWVLVHGCSAAVNDMAKQMGYAVQMITSPNGHTSRYTDAHMIDIYSAAAASVNQRLTAELMAQGVQTLGVAGPGVVRARRKEAIRAVRDGRPVIIRDDYSGSITGINTPVLKMALDAGLTPVIAPLALGEQFERLNVDGDLVAAAVAHDLSADTLIILSNVPGLLHDVSNPETLVTQFSLAEIRRYEPLAQGRMKKKVLAAQQANVPQVILADARVDTPLDAALDGAGTHIVREGMYAA